MDPTPNLHHLVFILFSGLLVSETRSHVAQADLELLILLFLFPNAVITGVTE